LTAHEQAPRSAGTGPRQDPSCAAAASAAHLLYRAIPALTSYTMLAHLWAITS